MNSIFRPVRGALTFLAWVLNTIFWTTPLYLLVVLKAIVPSQMFKDWCSATMVSLGENWILCNSRGLEILQNIEYTVEMPADLRFDKSYLVVANHQSWVDIVVLQRVLTKRIPFLRFFLKNELRYVPLLGGAWKALDFPFMKRHSKAYLEKHPEKRGEDLAATKRACDKLAGKKISIINFLEGTRFTEEKHRKQKSPFKHLLPPKVGGVAFVLQAMGQQFDSLLDVTIYYPEGSPTLWGLFTDRVRQIKVSVKQRPIPRELLAGDYFADDAFRVTVQNWIRDLWQEKDRLIDSWESKQTHV